MTVIRVSEHAAEPDGSFVVRVAFGEAAEYEARVMDPATEGSEGLLAWYFEQHLRFPFLDRDLRQQAETQLGEYGRSLFAQVLGGEANHDYRKLRDHAFDGDRVEISGSAAFHLLHWEALRDPDLDAPLAVRLPVTRRVDLLPSKFDLPPERATLNILLVTARPFGRGDIGYRTISRPLLDAMRHSILLVTIDLVRPGTWEALRAHLRSMTEHHGSGWYQVIHFDLHGGFSEFADLDQQRREGQLVFSGVPVQPFEGRRPFLFFEATQEGKAAPVPSVTVASLLAEHRIPVAVLNACQSAMQAGSEASLAQQLVEAGVPVAVGMAYSVTVSAAVMAMPVLYARLTQGADPVTAVHAARRALYEDTGRQAYYGQQLDLQDWVLPVAFRQQRVQLRLRVMDDEEQARFYRRQAAVGSEPATEYGFVGRDLDIQAIERRVLTRPDGNELLVQGMAGAGKSTLLRHLAWWWQRTGLVGDVFAFSFEERAWTASQIIRDIRTRLLSPVEQARADTMPGPAQLEQVAQLLRGARHLLILDNAESITATPAAIPHALDPSEQAQLKTLLARLHGGKSLVLIGSREGEAWLAPGTFDNNVYLLPGLDHQAASTLVDRILRRHSATGWLHDDAEREALNDLVDLLGGYPLPMTVVLSTLATATPSGVLAELKAGGTSPDPGGQIIRAVEYSHGKLDPALQAALLLLAPFTNVIPTGPALGYYHDLLLQDASIQAMNPDSLDAAISEAVRVGLATPHPKIKNMVHVQPVLPYFLRARLRQQDHLLAAITEAHYQHYNAIGPGLGQLLISRDDPQARATGQATTRAEYANLTAALNHGLETGQLIMILIRLLEEYLDQTKQQLARRKLLDDVLARYSKPASLLQAIELAMVHRLAGITALEQFRLEDARAHHETELRLLQGAEERQEQGFTYHQLGTVAYKQRKFAEAEAAYRQALDIQLEFGDRQHAGGTYNSLGVIAAEQERFTRAEAWYRRAVDTRLELGERYSAAETYLNLGVIAYQQRQLAEAEAAYRQALDIFLEFDDQHHAAQAYTNLGMVADEQQRFAEAEACYRRALDIFLGLGDRHSTGQAHYSLGTAARRQERFAEAQARYRQALDLFLEFGDRHFAARAYHNLATVALKQGQFAEAEAVYRRALDIFLEFGDRNSAAETYNGLGAVALRQGQFAEAEAVYRRALDIFLEFGDRNSAAQAYHNLGTGARGQNRFAEAETAYRQALDMLPESDQRLTSTIKTSLGVIIAERGRHDEATAIVLEAAVAWYQLTGDWDPLDMRCLKRERRNIGDEAFMLLVATKVPHHVQTALTTAIDGVADT